MKKLIVVAVILMAGPASAQTAPYRGYVAVQDILGERLLKRGPLSLSKYLEPMSPNDVVGLLTLLGTYAGSSEIKFINGQPNALNMLLWYLLLSGVSQDVANGCVRSESLDWSPAFARALNAICAWPAPEARDPAVMNAFWHALVSYDAPETELSAWRDFFLNSSFTNRPAAEAIPAMVLAALYNPNFLLKR